MSWFVLENPWIILILMYYRMAHPSQTLQCHKYENMVNGVSIAGNECVDNFVEVCSSFSERCNWAFISVVNKNSLKKQNWQL